DRDVGALPREGQRDRPAEATTAAGHEGGLAGEVEHQAATSAVSRRGWPRRVWSPGARKARAGSAVHSTTAAPAVKPAPKAAISSRSPALMRPAATASTSAIGTDAAEVLPYFSMFRYVFSIGMPTACCTLSMIRRLAWWKRNWSTSSTDRFAFRRAAREDSASWRVAYL